MRYKKNPKTRFELFKMILLLWYTAESENIKAFVYDRSEKYKQRQKLKKKYEEYLQMWEDKKQ